jgi:hypothetical protein
MAGLVLSHPSHDETVERMGTGEMQILRLVPACRDSLRMTVVSFSIQRSLHLGFEVGDHVEEALV